MTKKNSLEKFIDYAIYAPIGAVKIASDALAHASEVGKATIDSKTAMAKAVGKLAADYGTKQIENQIAVTAGHLKDKYFVIEAESTPKATTSESVTVEDLPGIDSLESFDEINESQSINSQELNIGSESLSISSYDTLAASQVISRLDGLNKEQLSLVFDYEKSNRRRRTVLAKLESMLGK